MQRKPAAPIVTDFVACVGCSAMYWLPMRPRVNAEFNYDKEFRRAAEAQAGGEGIGHLT